jgi:hypothetical protein
VLGSGRRLLAGSASVRPIHLFDRKLQTTITSSNSLLRGSGTPNQVDGVLVRAMSDSDLSRVRTGFRLHPPEPMNQSPPSLGADIVMQSSRTRRLIWRGEKECCKNRGYNATMPPARVDSTPLGAMRQKVVSQYRKQRNRPVGGPVRSQKNICWMERCRRGNPQL